VRFLALNYNIFDYESLFLSLNLIFFTFFYINRRVLDRAVIGYKRNIYDLIPTEKMEEEENILNLKIIIKRKGIINKNKKTIKATEITKIIKNSISDKKLIKRRRGGSD
jgi:hypothetical protein